MANKRVSELAPITRAELDPTDLFLLADVSANESKKLELQDLNDYVLDNGRFTGSFDGTASYAIHALSASWAPFQTSCSYALNSSFALLALTASYALKALSASYSFSGSYALTASYALSSSYQTAFSSAFSNLAKSASYLIYTPGVFNGTASYALTSSMSITSISASYAKTASYVVTSSYARTASYVANVNTASYALTASYVNTARNGVFQKLYASTVVPQTGTASTPPFMADIPNLIITTVATHDFPIYLINISVAVGGITAATLWRSSSFADEALLNPIAFISGGVGNCETIAASYLDSPGILKGDIIYYRGRVYNDLGNYYVNTSVDGIRQGTSTLSIIEF